MDQPSSFQTLGGLIRYVTNKLCVPCDSQSVIKVKLRWKLENCIGLEWFQ